MSLQNATPTPGLPLDELLAGYAAGTLPRPLHALVAAHLSIKPDNRRFVAALEDMGGQAIESAPCEPVKDRDRKLAAIFEAAERSGASRAAPPLRCQVVPPPLLDLLGKPVDALPWRTLLPGIRQVHLDDALGADATIYWIKPGRVMPAHTHEGSEVTLVLRGGFSDATGHYRRGDIAIADSAIDHRPRADADDDCICFAVIDAPLRLTGPVARFVRRVLGRH